MTRAVRTVLAQGGPKREGEGGEETSRTRFDQACRSKRREKKESPHLGGVKGVGKKNVLRTTGLDFRKRTGGQTQSHIISRGERIR